MSYPYELCRAEWTNAFPLDRVRQNLQHKAEADLAHRKEWFAGFTAEEQSQWQAWKPRDEINPAVLQPQFQNVVGPYELAIIEQVRAELGLEPSNAAAVANDSFVWALGEPEIRHVTKVGGLPYWPKNQPWPVIADDDEPNPKWRKQVGQPMTFLAQFCFSGSRDLFPDLPGDVLLMFVEDEEFSRPEAVRLEWQPFGLTSLVEAADVTLPSWKFISAFGYRSRTADYSEFEGNADGFGSAGDHLRSLGATKIGGLPHRIQPALDDESASHPPERFLAQLSSLITTDDHYYPWINHREPWTDSTDDERCLNLVDAGLVSLHLTLYGHVTWGFECY